MRTIESKLKMATKMVTKMVVTTHNMAILLKLKDLGCWFWCYIYVFGVWEFIELIDKMLIWLYYWTKSLLRLILLSRYMPSHFHRVDWAWKKARWVYLKSLKSLPKESTQRIQYKILILTYKSLNDMAPVYLKELLTVKSNNRALRSNGKLLLHQPRLKLENYGCRSFSYAAPRMLQECFTQLFPLCKI